MSYIVTYKVTGFLNDTLLVKFSLGSVSETLSFQYDSSKPFVAFLEQQAMWALPRLKQKLEQPEPPDLMQYVGTTGTVTLPDAPIPLPPMAQPAFFTEHPDPTQVSQPPKF